MNLRKIILELESKIQGFNKFPFDYNNFLDICDKENIKIDRWNFIDIGIKGLIIWNNDKANIGLDAELRGFQLMNVAFRELGHFFITPQQDHFFLKEKTLLLDPVEYAVKIFSMLCIMPTTKLDKIIKSKEEKDEKDIAYEYDVPVKFVSERFEIYNRHKGNGQLSLI